MSELLRDPMWQFISTLLAIIAVFISVFFYWKQRRKKDLSYEIVSSTPLISAREEYKGKLRILFENKEVEQVHLVVVRIFNNGNVPITAQDYEREISVGVSGGAQILTAEVVETSPRNLESSLNASINDMRNVTFNRFLLNGGDSFTLRMLVAKFSEVFVDGRIAGVKEIRKFREPLAKILAVTFLGIVVMAIGMVFVGFYKTDSFLYFLGVIMIFVGLLMYALPLMLRKKMRRVFSRRFRRYLEALEEE